MHFIFGEIHGNRLAAQRNYERRFPNRRVPHRSVFVAVDRRLRKIGQVELKTADRGRSVDDDDAVDRDKVILDIANTDPTLSINPEFFQSLIRRIRICLLRGISNIFCTFLCFLFF
jgi:hypothetical protein